MCAGGIRAAGAVGAGGWCRSLAGMAARVRDLWLSGAPWGGVGTTVEAVAVSVCHPRAYFMLRRSRQGGTVRCTGAVVVPHMTVVVGGSAAGKSVAAFPTTGSATAPRSCAANSARAVGARPSTIASPQAAEATCVITTSATRSRRGFGS